MTRLLCATDLLPKSEWAIDRAGLLAGELHARLSLLHVVSPSASEKILEQTLQTAISRMKARARPPLWRSGPNPDVGVRAGNPARLVLDSIERTQPDLTIIGPHRKRGVLDALDGTLAQKILYSQHCPLLIVQQPAEVAYRKVLLALDLSPESSAAVQATESLLLKSGGQGIVVHAWEPPYQGMLRAAGVKTSEIMAYSETARREVAMDLRDLISRQGADFRRYEVVIAPSHAVPAILRAVELYRPDVLVMGTRGDGRIRRALLGSVANQLMREVDCDVLIVPRDSVETATRMKEEEVAPSSA